MPRILTELADGGLDEEDVNMVATWLADHSREEPRIWVIVRVGRTAGRVGVTRA
jgi:hypothetical protein